MLSEEITNTGLSLIEKGKKGVLHALFSRLGIIILLMLVQLLALAGAFFWFEETLPVLIGSSTVFTVCMVLYLLNSQMDPSAKITWLVTIMLLPVFGSLFYWYTQSEWGHRTLKSRLNKLYQQTQTAIPYSDEADAALQAQDRGAATLAHYIRSTGTFPVYQNTSVTYFPQGEDKWQQLLTELQNAKKFIFLEYFIVDEGLMWGRILEILAQKAKEGVDVRVMYDGTCELTTLPHDYPKRLQALGIQCKMFSPITPFISTHYNYRDHRKILVIDGHTAFNGGVNLADEYINHIHRFGHWKDTAVMLKGEAVQSFTLMFLQMWNIDEHTPVFEPFLQPAPPVPASGFVIPYGDCPLDNQKLGERVYMDFLNRAVNYVHIMTPYLILDGEMETALKFAAERGVDVRIILPGIPDKKTPYALAKSHYRALLESGVKIYEYTPGFVHAKVFVSDHQQAVVGTINLDYRSLYHHFECATYLYGTDCIADIEQDFQTTLEKCAQVTWDTVKNEKLLMKLTGIVIKPFAPLL